MGDGGGDGGCRARALSRASVVRARSPARACSAASHCVAASADESAAPVTSASDAARVSRATSASRPASAGTCAGAAGTRAAGTPSRAAQRRAKIVEALGLPDNVVRREQRGGRGGVRGAIPAELVAVVHVEEPVRSVSSLDAAAGGERASDERARTHSPARAAAALGAPGSILVAGTALVPGRPRRAARTRRPHAVRREQVGEWLPHDRRGEQRRVARAAYAARKAAARRHDRAGKKRFDVRVELKRNARAPPLGRQRGEHLACAAGPAAAPTGSSSGKGAASESAWPKPTACVSCLERASASNHLTTEEPPVFSRWWKRMVTGAGRSGSLHRRHRRAWCDVVHSVCVELARKISPGALPNSCERNMADACRRRRGRPSPSS